MGFLDDLLKKAARKIGGAVAQEAKNILRPAVKKAEDAITEAAAKAVVGTVKEAVKPKEDKRAEKAPVPVGGDPFEEALNARNEAEQAPPAAGSGEISWGEGGTAAYWNGLLERWEEDQKKNSGYVWTVSIDQMTAMDAAGLVKMKYDLALSCSHVGEEMDGVYRGSLAMAYGADLSGITAMIGAMGGRTSTNSMKGWFRNDNFIMELKPYSREKEEAFIHGLDLIIDENMDVVPKPSDNPYADAVAAPFLAQMGSGSEAFEKENAPVSYWFDWDYHMTSGDISSTYAVSGVMGMASAQGSIDESGSHVAGSGRAVSPLGVYTDRYEKEYESPFPYVIRVYGNDRVVFELHSPEGGPVVIKFYGRIDRIPVSQTVVVNE